MTNFASTADKNKFKKILHEFFRVLLFFVVLLIAVLFLTNLHIPRVQIYGCDMEKVVQWKNKPHFVTEGCYFDSGQLQTEELARSGNFSVKVGGKNQYALSHEYPNLTGFEVVTITAWRHSAASQKGSIVISIPNKILWQSGAKVIEKTADGWEKIQLVHAVPRAAKNKKLTIYLWHPSKAIAYFDDLEVKIVQEEVL